MDSFCTQRDGDVDGEGIMVLHKSVRLGVVLKDMEKEW